MSWDIIDNVKPSKSTLTIPPHGIYVASRGLKVRRGGKDRGEIRFIKISLGRDLARKLVLNTDSIGVKLMFGSEENRGKIKISIDATSGNFIAKPSKNGIFTITLNSASAEGLFALDFPSFAIPTVEALRPSNGQPPHCIFRVSDAMLAVED